MSRVASMVFAMLLLCPHSINAQSPNRANAEEMIAKAKALTALDRNGCLKSPEPDIIVVCGESDDNRSQRVFERVVDPNHRVAGDAVSSDRAAECIAGTGCVPRMKGGVKMGFGYVPPPAIPLEDVYRGLPEPDMVVIEGSGEAEVPR